MTNTDNLPQNPSPTPETDRMRIVQVGSFDVDGNPIDWVFDGTKPDGTNSDIPAIAFDSRTGQRRWAGYSLEDLHQAYAKHHSTRYALLVTFTAPGQSTADYVREFLGKSLREFETTMRSAGPRGGWFTFEGITYQLVQQDPGHVGFLDTQRPSNA